MTAQTDADKLLAKEQCKKNAQDLFTVDNSKNTIYGMDTDNIYSLNVLLMTIYYILFFIFVYFIYSSVRNSPQKIKKIVFIILLFLYPIIIFPLQYNVYNTISYLIRNGYENVYITKEW